MANNIQIVGNILNSSTISRYSDQDVKLLSTQEVQDNFGSENDYIEYYIYDVSGNLLNISYDYKDFKLPPNAKLTPPPNNLTSNTTNEISTTNVGIISNTNTQTGSLYPIIEIDPIQDIKNNGYNSGEFVVRYNFFKNKISSPSAELFIKQISPDRTEISVSSTILTNEEIETSFNNIISEIDGSEFFVDYLLNFGNNQQALAVNIALNKLDSGYEIYFKLYEPLPLNIVEKNTLWVVDEQVDPYVFNINLDTLILPEPSLSLRGPNFNIPINQQGTISTPYKTYDALLNNLQSIQNSSYSKILNILTTQSIDINVDYTNFSNFSFFGSARERLVNFHNKVEQIENYNNLINTYLPDITVNSSLQLEISSSRNNIDDIISKFDGFEYYLYFESSSFTWPKTNSTLPYTLYPVNSSETIDWYNNYINSATLYDENNVNILKNSIPSFVIDDYGNEQYLTFIDMIGQYFDNIWIFLKAITDINLANNNLEKGVSKDLVYHVLKSYGIKLYNAQGGEDLNDFLIGTNSGSVNFDDDFSPTSSYLNNIPKRDLLAEIYKRIYHNLPYLVKNKGTVAGVEGLISIFGITGSILNTKEFGGNKKSSILKGYNNDKVRIINNNTITGSVLSPFISLQQSPTSSLEFIDDDLHYLDVSFSPQTQIDTYISGAIASNNPTFSLDDYIGDPRQQYDNLYVDLKTQQKLYFETGVSGYPAFTGSNMDYNGFIRLIQFFDNALFKMIADFVPARTSLSTGITINSPVLERNKVSYAKPLLTNQEVFDAVYNAPQITPEYDFLYDNLGGDKAAFYNGELSGSNIDLYNKYFLPNNFNPYLLPTSSLTPGDLNKFDHSDFNVLLNNVYENRISLIKRKIEYKSNNTGSLNNRIITYPAHLQDYYDSLTSHVNSRYVGTKVSSTIYNTYTQGDNSFGKTAAIDSQVRKIGLFTQISTSSFFPNKNGVLLKYLVDEFGNLTELNQQNIHWEEIQRTFKSGDILSVSLFDNKKYGNQKSTDGNKRIFNSGYLYSPIFYFTACSNDTASFQNLEGTNAYFSRAANVSSSYFISGSNTNLFSLDNGNVTSLFNTVIEGSDYFTPGDNNNFPTYSVQETANHRINANLPVLFSADGNTLHESTWTFSVLKNGVEIASDVYNFKAGDPATAILTFSGYNNKIFYFTLSEPIPSSDIIITSARVDIFGGSSCIDAGGSDSTSQVIIPAGSTSGEGIGSFISLEGSDFSYRRDSEIRISINPNTTLLLGNGDTFNIGGTVVTVNIDFITCVPLNFNT